MRKLATIQKILDIKPIEGADLICAYKVKGWWVVDKKGAFEKNDLVVYFEIDSWVPTELAPFLSKGKEPSTYNGIKGERLRSQKFKGQMSQGLILKVQGNGPSGTAWNIKKPNGLLYYVSGLQEDVTEILGVVKWEPVLPASLNGDIKGLFPACIPKTVQERIQNIKFDELLSGKYEITEKLNGSSMTVLLDIDGNFEVCSRNFSLKEQETNAYWKAVKMYYLKEKMIEQGLQGYAIQGELVGHGILGNQYKTSLDFYVFDMYDAVFQRYLTSSERLMYCEKLGLKHVPMLCNSFNIGVNATVDSLLTYAEGKSELNGSEREGCVFVSTCDPSLSFKVISNKWLLKGCE